MYILILSWTSNTNADVHFDATFNQQVAPSPQKLLGLNDVTFNLSGATDSASVVEAGSALTTSQTTKSDGRGLWNGQPRTELGQQFKFRSCCNRGNSQQK